VVAVLAGLALILAAVFGDGRALVGERDVAAPSTSAAAKPVVQRSPAVAGQFYPGNPTELRAEVAQCLERAQGAVERGRLVSIIVPHAGYSYSAPVAAHAYRQLQGKHFDTVVVIGPSHYMPFPGVALSGADKWDTPLGPVPLDRRACDALMKADKSAQVLDAAHTPEHSIEVQLPFLQTVLKDFKLVPLLMTDFSEANCSALARALAQWAKGRSVLLVASSDMSHYPSYADANRVDGETLKAIQSLDAKAVAAAAAKSLARGIPNLATCLCGEGPVKTVLMASRLLGADRAKLLRYANSGDVAGSPRERVVGYCAVAIYSSKPAPAPSSQADTSGLNQAQQQRLLALARSTIEQYVTAGHVLEGKETDPALLRPAAAFVTLRERGQLRGCIGSLEPDAPLHQTVRDKAIAAATQDPRFRAVTAAELPELEIEVSVLSPLRRVASADEVHLPQHGVVVAADGRRGVFLPQVATETGWSRNEFLDHLCADKAGLPADAWRHGAALYVFTVQAFSSPAPREQSHGKQSGK